MILWRQLFWTFFKNLIIMLTNFLLISYILNLYFYTLYSIINYITAVYSSQKLWADSFYVDVANLVKTLEAVILL